MGSITMAFDNIKIKISTINNVGSKLDDQLEAINNEIKKLEGGLATLKQVHRNVDNFVNVVDSDLRLGKFDEFSEKERVAETIKSFIKCISKSISNTNSQCENAYTKLLGKQDGLNHSIKLVKSMLDEEAARLSDAEKKLNDGLIQIDENGDPVHVGDIRDRVPGIKPASLSKQRKDEMENAKDS